MSLRVGDLDAISASSEDRHCRACDKTIRSADDWTDDDMRRALEAFPSLCVFATTAAKNIIVLKPIGKQNPNVHDLPVIRTARSLDVMEDGYRSGCRLVVKPAGPVSEIGPKYKVFQHNRTGEIWWSQDLRGQYPDTGDRDDWELVADWFHHQPDLPFPLAAYLVPRGLNRGRHVYLEDVIQNVPVPYWNQGDAHRLLSSEAVWNGYDFELETFEAEPEIIG